jgi:hypothetical protein
MQTRLDQSSARDWPSRAGVNVRLEIIRDWVALHDRGGSEVSLCWQNLESRLLTTVQNKMRMNSSKLSITIEKSNI